MSAQDDFVRKNLDILQQMQLEGIDGEDLIAWQGKIDVVKREYDAARAIERDTDRSDKDRKAAKERADAIAKAGPAITKSVISAIKAFTRGDSINGAAEIMDICASLAPLISTFLSAAGPEGALIGAFFSIIGQILRCFGPKEDSDVDKLEKFIKNLEAQTKLENMKAVHDDVLTYAVTLTQQAAFLQRLLSKPLETHEDFIAFDVELKASTIVVGDKNPHTSPSQFEHWKVVEYLAEPANQDDPLWPAVLGICCKTYSDLVSSTMTITAMTRSDDLMARRALARPDSSGPLSQFDKHDLEQDLNLLIAYGKARMLEYQAVNARMLRALKGVTKVAQAWGFHACIADNYALKLVSGPKKVKAGDWKDVSDRNYYHRLMLVEDATETITDGQVSSDFNFKPTHHCFVLKTTSSSYPGSHHWVDHLWVHSDTLDVDHVRNVLDSFEPAFTGIWASGQDAKALDVFASTAEGTGAPGSITKLRLGSTDNFNTDPLVRENWWPQTTSPAGTIAAVTAPVSPLGDPDADALAPGWGETMIYASMSGSQQVYLNFGNRDHYIPGVPGWGPCTGVAVDQNYVWLYQPYGFAVASHASVLSHVGGKRSAPRWIAFPHLGDTLLGARLNRGDGVTTGEKYRVTYNGRRVDTKPPLLGLVSLSPCSDGTLFAAVVHRDIEETPVPYQYRRFDVTDTRTIQAAAYQVDVDQGTVSVGAWTQIPGEARQVQKLPMPGYTLLSSLMTNLSAKLT